MRPPPKRYVYLYAIAVNGVDATISHCYTTADKMRAALRSDFGNYATLEHQLDNGGAGEITRGDNRYLITTHQLRVY